ncbi:MAG: SH3 domain-containing protein [Pseudomonadota bacterium]
MKHRAIWGCLALAAVTLPSAAQQPPIGLTSTAVNLRAGPAPDYPIVMVLPPGYQVAVQGCLPDYTWCDVLAGPERGWLDATYINYPYLHTHVPVLTYGPTLGIAVVPFVHNDYWLNYYRNRPWYSDQRRWSRQPAPPLPYPPRPPSGEIRPRPQLPSPSGFVGPGGQINPPPPQGTGPGAWRPPGQYERDPNGVRPPRPSDSASRDRRDDRREDRRDDRRGDRRGDRQDNDGTRSGP